MRYVDAPILDQQRKPLVPNKIISGMLPGATEIRIGGNENIKISGKDQNISITSSGTSLSFGNQGAGDLQLALSDGTTNIIKLGNLGSDFIGLAFNDSSNDRIFVGKNSSGSYVAKLSQAGYDAQTAPDDKLIWSSDFNAFKIVETGIASIQGGNNDVTFASVNFNRTYEKPPIVIAYATVTDTGTTTSPKLLPYVNYVGDAGAIPPMYGAYYILDVGATTTTVTFTLDATFNGTGSSVSATIRYYIVQETAASS